MKSSARGSLRIGRVSGEAPEGIRQEREVIWERVRR